MEPSSDNPYNSTRLQADAPLWHDNGDTLPQWLILMTRFITENRDYSPLLWEMGASFHKKDMKLIATSPACTFARLSGT